MILIKLRNLFDTTLGISSEVFSTTLKLGDHPAWDSLQHFKLICAVEDTFQVRFLPSEIEEMQSVEDIYNKIGEKLND